MMKFQHDFANALRAQRWLIMSFDIWNAVMQLRDKCKRPKCSSCLGIRNENWLQGLQSRYYNKYYSTTIRPHIASHNGTLQCMLERLRLFLDFSQDSTMECTPNPSPWWTRRKGLHSSFFCEIHDRVQLCFHSLSNICWNASLIAQMEVLFPTLQNRWF